MHFEALESSMQLFVYVKDEDSNSASKYHWHCANIFCSVSPGHLSYHPIYSNWLIPFQRSQNLTEVAPSNKKFSGFLIKRPSENVPRTLYRCVWTRMLQPCITRLFWTTCFMMCNWPSCLHTCDIWLTPDKLCSHFFQRLWRSSEW